MVLVNSCCCVSTARIPSQWLVLPRKQSPRTCSRLALNTLSPIGSGFHGLRLRATTSEDSSSGTNEYVSGERETIATVEVQVEEKPSAAQNSYTEGFPSVVSIEEPPAPTPDQPQAFEISENFDLKLDSKDTLPIALYGSGALVTLWLASTVIGAIDSIPLFPKLMEIVGLAYTVWFAWQYLIFQESRKELFNKISDLKQQVLGSEDE
ncbi:hypothetical protein SAY86_028311 [Trapa natans]|uniref:Cyanobacterial aminoacyl-tRNA synthetase CAAD domain-containing protein n=1 Tax=Trapa natans TaxID=22666 RepID=A0AAN7MFA6_TRANT|nr:hypothetical protein SAY86_028311 [Trapa natans]